MNLTITISNGEVEVIKKYLEEVIDIEDPDKNDITSMGQVWVEDLTANIKRGGGPFA